jgi:hypothetical protein
VTEVQARSKAQSKSKLGIAFDHLLLKEGSQVPLAASIQAIAQVESSATAAGDYDQPAMGSAGGMGGRSGLASARGGARATTPVGTTPDHVDRNQYGR